MNAEIADLDRAFALLHDAVEGLVAQGKTAATAGVKPEMQRRSYGSFDEQRLGFATFRDFVRAAEQAGVVRVTHRGPGVPIWLRVTARSPRRGALQRCGASAVTCGRPSLTGITHRATGTLAISGWSRRPRPQPASGASF